MHIKLLIENRDAIVKSWNKRGPWGTIKGITPTTWNLIAQYALKNQSVKIDTVVTPDVNRLIRLKNTLHGKTGLKKIELSIRNIDDFDPLKSAIAFGEGEVTLYVSDVPQFRVDDENHGPFKKQKVELPTAAALMLLCKGVAKVVN
jgi:DNA primase small subunit